MRYTRHDLKQDKFAASAAEAVQEVVEHRSLIIRAVAVIVVLGIIGAGIFLFVSSREQRATDALGQALVIYSAPVVPPGTPQQGSMTVFNSDQERLIAAKKAKPMIVVMPAGHQPNEMGGRGRGAGCGPWPEPGAHGRRRGSQSWTSAGRSPMSCTK